MESEFPPNHLIHHARVGLDNLDDLGRDVFVYVGWYRDAVVAGGVHGNGGVHGLEEGLFVDAGEDEAGLVQGFRALGRCADAHGRERVPDAGEEGTFLREGAAVGDHREGVHLQAVVIMEAEGFMLDDPRVKLEARGFQPLAGARVAGVKNRHIIFLRHRIDRIEQAQEVLLRVDVFFPMRAEQNVLAFHEAQSLVHVARLDVGEVLVENLRHRAPGHVRPLLRQPALRQIPPRVLRVREIDIRNDIDNPPIRLLRQALVLAPVSGLHVEDRDMQPLGADHAQAAIRVAQHQHCVGLNRYHQLVAFGNDIAHGFAEVSPHGIHIHLRRGEFQILEKHAIKVVIIVLPRVRQNRIKIRPALVNHRRQPDDFRARPDDNKKLKLAVVGKRNLAIIHIRI